MGVTFLDTAEVYGPFDNEVLVGGKAIKGFRDKVQCHQIWISYFADRPGLERMAGVDQPSGTYSRIEVEGSLETTECRDHQSALSAPRRSAVPVEEVVGTMADLVKEGKIRHIGLSEVSAPDAAAGPCKVHPIAAVQTEYSLCGPRAGGRCSPLLPRAGVGFVPYSPLGRTAS
ncbi:aldo/keto reductase [Klebsiella pneumoniae]|nr:aldo/keto reductase [Klebsiella pneumoniae]